MISKSGRRAAYGRRHDDGVLPERHTAQLRTEAEILERLQRLDTIALALLLIRRRDRAARAGLHDPDGHAVGAQFVDAVLIVGPDAVDHEIRPEALHRQRFRQARIEFGQRRARDDQHRKPVAELGDGLRAGRPLGTADARHIRVEAHQAQRRVEKLRNPARRRVAAVDAATVEFPHRDRRAWRRAARGTSSVAMPGPASVRFSVEAPSRSTPCAAARAA